MTDSGIIGVKGPVKQFHKENDYMRFLSTIVTTGLSSFNKYDIFPGNNIFILFTNKDFLPMFNISYFAIISENSWFNRYSAFSEEMDFFEYYAIFLSGIEKEDINKNEATSIISNLNYINSDNIIINIENDFASIAYYYQDNINNYNRIKILIWNINS